MASLHSAVAGRRTESPPGALAVRAGAPPASGMFETIISALAVLPNDDSMQTIFIFLGMYNELVSTTRPGPSPCAPNPVAASAKIGRTADANGSMRYLKGAVDFIFGRHGLV